MLALLFGRNIGFGVRRDVRLDLVVDLLSCRFPLLHHLWDNDDLVTSLLSRLRTIPQNIVVGVGDDVDFRDYILVFVNREGERGPLSLKKKLTSTHI